MSNRPNRNQKSEVRSQTSDLCPLPSGSKKSPILDCPGLKRTRNAGVSWTDSAGHVHDLVRVPLLTYEQAAARADLGDIGFATPRAVAELVRSGRLYPAHRINCKLVRIFACALPDFRRRFVVGGATALRHLAQTRAEKVA